MSRTRRLRWSALGLAVIGAIAFAGWGWTGAEGGVTSTSFEMVRSTAAVNAHCVRNGEADVTIKSNGTTETMTVQAKGLPKNTDFDFFVIQVPDAPFGLSWYQGDIQTDREGRGTGTFIGRFSVETFIVAPGTAGAPTPHGALDANTNPATKPVHTFHLGLWFNSPQDAAKAGCPDTVTPFNGTHTAGVQVLSTRNFTADEGPLSRIH